MKYYSKLSMVVHYWWNNNELRLVWSVKVFSALANLRLLIFSLQLSSAKLSFHLGEVVPSPWRRSASGAGFYFLLFFLFSLLALLSIPAKLTQMRG